MPAPRSRRMARSSPSNPPPEVPVEQQEDIEVVDPAPIDDYAEQSMGAAETPLAADSSASSRRSRAGGRSSRRAAASSGRTSARREATPEERAARRASMWLVVKILLGVIVGGGLAFAVWWVFMRVDVRVSTATQAIANVEGLLRSIDNDLSQGAAADAEKRRGEALAALDIPELGHASATPDPNNPKLANLKLALSASELKDRLDKGIRTRVERAERDSRVVANLRQVQGGFGKLTQMTDAELTNFEKDTRSFLDNPVMPAAGRVEQYVGDYKTEISTVNIQMKKIEDEKSRRLSEITDLPVQQARSQAAVLVQQEKFQEALAVIDDLQRTYAGANFTGVRQYVVDAAKQSWDTAKSMSDENYKTYRGSGTSQEMRDASLKAAQTRMEQVIERFGIEDYVSQAKQALAGYTP